MSKAKLLINSELGPEKDLLDQIKSIQNVREVHLAYGVYDLIAIIEAGTQDKLKEIITRKN